MFFYNKSPLIIVMIKVLFYTIILRSTKALDRECLTHVIHIA